MKQIECLRCGHKWQKRIKKPVMCPACKSRYWGEVRNVTEDDAKQWQRKRRVK